MGSFPESSCPFGKLAVESKSPEEGCAWYINSEVDHYCFWKWVRRVSDSEGFMEPMLQHEISELLGYSSTKIHAIFKEAVDKLKTFEEFEDLKEAFSQE